MASLPRLRQCLHGIRLGALALLLFTITPTIAPAQFTAINAGLAQVHHGSAIWGNYNNDTWLDLFLSGWLPNATFMSDGFKNTAGTFAPGGFGTPGVASGVGRNRSAWGDYDGDNDIDLIITGQLMGFSSIANLYENQGGVAFPQKTVVPSAIPGIALSSVSWGDYDNDGDLDLFVEGTQGGPFKQTTVYRNDGPSGVNWIFTNTSPAMTLVDWGDAAWGDYDNDGDMDLVVTGFTMIGGAPLTTLYNNSGGVFVPSGIALPAVGRSSVAWGDYDNDGYLDLALGGVDNSGFLTILQVYRNNAGTSFSLAASIPGGIQDGSVAWGDYNNDGNFDLVITGDNAFGPPVADVYTGNGAGTFTALGAGLTGVGEGEATWGDYDNDGRLDILLAGQPANAVSFTDIYRGKGPANTPPSTPTGLIVTAVSAHSITVGWNPSTDVQSPQATLTYNLSIKDAVSGHFVMSPMANLSTGLRWIPALGNTNHNTSWTVTGLAPGHTYEICVQAIDQAFAGSKFNCGMKVTTDKEGPDVMIGDCAADVGTEPNNACTDYWMSSDVFVRNQQDGFADSTNQGPLSGVDNWVYVNLENIGTVNMASGTVYVYYAKASTGLAWPMSWINNYIGAIPYGDVVGSAPVTNLAAGNRTRVEIKWQNVPDPSDYNDPDAHHFCLLARFVAAPDPMTFPEGTSVGANAQNNNNIAWKNVSIIDIDGPQAPLEIHNVQAVPVVTALQFEVPETEVDDNILTHCKVKVDLGKLMYERWVAGGRKGAGIKSDEAPSSTTIEITSTRAHIRNIAMGPGEQLTIHVIVEYPKEIPEDLAKKVYHWSVQQFTEEKKGATFVGGETYEIHMGRVGGGGGGDRGNLKRGAPGANDFASMLKLGVRPNPATAATTISYTLLESGRITISLHDGTGRLVRRLLVDADQEAGMREIVWDGTGADGKPVPSGAYFCRVTTARGTAERQIQVVH